jgi:hypothetical protein
LLDIGVTHILNVSECASELACGEGGFREVVWRPLVDLERIPDADAINCLDSLHRMVCEPGSQVYVHCIAGRNRSATVIWLYLVACGIDPEQARIGIGRRSPSSFPAHPKMVEQSLVEFIKGHGHTGYRPHSRPNALEWVLE